jgi:hypothetical protein
LVGRERAQGSRLSLHELRLSGACMHRFLLLSLLLASGVAQQWPPIGIIDFYGRRTVAESDLRAALQIREGDSVPRTRIEIEQRLRSVPGVEAAQINLVCCEENKAILYVGIREKGAPALQFRAAPTGSVRLTPEVVRLGEEFDRAHENAIRRGVFGEDRSRGYSLMDDSAARAVQLRFIPLANRQLAQLIDVLRSSNDSGQRAIAAQVMAYADDRASVVKALSAAILDPAENVRNNAVRALALLAFHAQDTRSGISVPTEPLVELLNSPVWTDLNKASLALSQLTEKRDPALLALLREKAFPALVDIASWKTPGHAQPAFFILGRMAGLSDEQTFAAWQRGDRASVIAAARQR